MSSDMRAAGFPRLIEMHWWTSLRTRSALKRLVRDLDPGIALTLVDVGSAGGLKDRWQLLQGRVHSYCFDPREEATVRQELGRTVLPYAVGRETGMAEFLTTRFGNMSSILQPNAELLYRFQDREYKAEVVSIDTLPVRRIDDVVPGPTADALKVDAQGSELDILVGAQKLLGSGLLLAEVEVSFFERYIGQPLFGEIAAFMRSHGFELFDFYYLHHYYRTNRLMLRKYQIIPDSRSGQIAYADAIFFLSDAAFQAYLGSLPADGQSAVFAKFLLLLLIYGKFDCALQLFDERQLVLSESVRNTFAAFFSTLPPGRRRAAANRDGHVHA